MMRKGEWWRALLNFFFMGDSVKSIFFWFQMLNSYDFFKTLETTKYRWEPMAMVKMILSNAFMISIFRIIFPWNVYLGAPLSSAFLYLYTREFGAVPMNWLGFISIPTGWLPCMQMIQDLLQTGDISPNLLGFVSGHIYYFFNEVLPLASPADKRGLRNLVKLFLHGQADVIDWASYHDESENDDDDGQEAQQSLGDEIEQTADEDMSDSSLEPSTGLDDHETLAEDDGREGSETPTGGSETPSSSESQEESYIEDDAHEDTDDHEDIDNQENV